MHKLEKYSSYKDSGVERIGEIPEYWTINRINTVGTIVSGATPSSSVLSYWNGDIMWITPTDINNKVIIRESERTITAKGYASCGAFLVPEGTIVMTTRAPIGKLVIAGKILCTNQGCKSIIPTKDFDNRFIYFQLLVNSEKLNSLGTGTTFMELSKTALKNLFLAFPPKEEQTKIANFLDKKTVQIDEVVKQKEELISLLKERRQVLIHKAVTQGLDATVKMKDSGVKWMGKVPEHWVMEKVKYIFNLIIDPAPNNNNFELLSIYTDIGVKPRKDLAEKGNKASTTDGYWKVRKGDFIVNKLLAWMGAIGLSEYDGVTSPAYDILRAINPIEGVYFHELFRMKVFSQEMKKHSRGIMDMRLRLYFDKFGDIRVPLPPVEEQKEIVRYIKINSDKIENVISLQEKQITKLKEYKATLIDSAVTGKVRVV